MSTPTAARACALFALAASLTGACGGGDDNAPTTATTTDVGAPAPSTTTGAGATATTTTAAGARTIELAYAGGQVSGGVRTESVRVGAMVVLRVTSDVAEEVHVHTYDAMADVAAGRTAEVRFTATVPGRFEVELEKSGRQLLVLEVR